MQGQGGMKCCMLSELVVCNPILYVLDDKEASFVTNRIGPVLSIDLY